MFSSSSGAACLISSADAEVRWVDEGWDISAPVRRRTIPFTTRIRHPVEKDWVGSRCSRGLLVPFRSSDAGWRDLALWKLTDSFLSGLRQVDETVWLIYEVQRAFGAGE